MQVVIAGSDSQGLRYGTVTAGEKVPARMNDRAQFVLLYDDEPVASSWLECAFASCGAGGIRESDLKEQLRRRGKGELL